MTTQQTVKCNWCVALLAVKESHRATVRGLGLRKMHSTANWWIHLKFAA
jgi:hypothetical protein